MSTPEPRLSTDELASLFLVKPNTPRRAYCEHEHYMGLVPRKPPNGKLDWPREKAHALVEGSQAEVKA